MPAGAMTVAADSPTAEASMSAAAWAMRIAMAGGRHNRIESGGQVRP